MSVYINGEKVGVVKDVLAGGYDVESVELEDGTQELQITEIGGIPANRKWASLINGNITELTESDFEGVVIPRSGVFAGTSLVKVTIPDSISQLNDSLFQACPSLISVKLSNSIKYIPVQCFLYCTALTNIVIPENVISIGYGAFWGCESLTNIIIPININNIENMAFRHCKSLTKVKFKSPTPPTIQTDTFEGCTALTTIAVPTGYLEAYQNATNYESLVSLMVEED